jgi:hypothetical protein
LCAMEFKPMVRCMANRACEVFQDEETKDRWQDNVY